MAFRTRRTATRAALLVIALTLVLGLAAPGPARAAGDWSLYDHQPWEKVDVPGASCGAGTPYRFFFSASNGDPSTNRVVFWFPGGGSTSYNRDGQLGSPIRRLSDVRGRLTAPANGPQAVPSSGVLPFLDHPANDAFIGDADWVILPYCTQDFHSGNVSEAKRYDFSSVGSLVNEIKARLNADCGLSPQDLEASFHIDIDVSGTCPQSKVDGVWIDIRHEGGIDFAKAYPLIKALLAEHGFDISRGQFLIAGSSAGGFGAWYNAWRIGDDIAEFPRASLTIAPMSGSPNTRLWDQSAHDLREDPGELADLENRIEEQQVRLPCRIDGGAYHVGAAPERCNDTLELIRHYERRWPDLDLRIVPVINKEDLLGVRGFAGDTGAPEHGPRLLRFCRTVHAYGEYAARRDGVDPWTAWLWEQQPSGVPRRVHGLARADQLVPLAAPSGSPGYPPGDGMHGVLAYVNQIAARAPGLDRKPMIDYRLSLVEDPSDVLTGLDGSFSGEWSTLGIDPGSCNVSIPIRFSGLDKHRDRGTATALIAAPGPGRLRLAGTKRVRGVRRQAKPGVAVKLPVKPRRRARNWLRRRGAIKVSARVTFLPRYGDPSTQTRRLKLIRR